MNNIEKISRLVRKKLIEEDNTKPTLAIMYDSIIEVYPKFNNKGKKAYECYRAVIINAITTYYDNKAISELDTIKLILSQMIQEC